VWHVGQDSGEHLSKRKGGRLYIHVPGDWGDEILEPVPNDDGRVYYESLDGLELYYGSQAADKYHPDVGRSQGTAHLPAEDFPLVRARLRGGQAKQRHGDISIVVPDHWYKRHLAPGANSQGGKVRTRAEVPVLGPDGTPVLDPQGNPVTRPLDVAAAAVGRDGIVASTLVPLMITPEIPSSIPGGAPTAGSPEPVAVLSGPGWCGLLNLFHEDFSLNPEGNVNLEGSFVPSPFGGVLNTATVAEYLDLNPQAGGPLISTGSFCQLIPMTAGSAPHVNLGGYSYMVGIALLAEYVESYLGGNTLANIIDNIYATHSYCRALAKAVKTLWCILQLNLNIADEFPTIGELRSKGKDVLKSICETPCEEPQLGTGEEPPPPPPGEDGAPAIGP